MYSIKMLYILFVFLVEVAPICLKALKKLYVCPDITSLE